MVLGENFAPMMLIAKAKDWEKEEEYRLVCPLSEGLTEAKGSPLVMKDGFLAIGDLLNAIVLGCQIEPEKERAIKDLLKEHGQRVRLKRAIRVPHRYDLALEDVV